MELILLIAVFTLLLIGGIAYVVKHKALEAKIDAAVTSIQSKVTTEVGDVKSTLKEHGGVLGTLKDKAENVLTGAVAEKAKADIAAAKADLAAFWERIKADVGIDAPPPSAVVVVPGDGATTEASAVKSVA